MLRLDKGFALMSTLLILLIVSLISTTILQNEWLALKKQIAIQYNYHSFSQAETLLNHIQAQLGLGNESCLFPVKSLAELKRFSRIDWHNHSCHSSQANALFYRIENIGVDSCGRIGKQLAKFFRISVFHFTSDNGAHVFLQSIMVLPTAEHLSCSTNYHTVSAGPRMWRQII